MTIVKTIFVSSFLLTAYAMQATAQVSKQKETDADPRVASWQVSGNVRYYWNRAGTG